MGKVQGNRITGAHSGRGSSGRGGRACKHRRHLHQDQQENGCVLLREALQPMYTTIKKGNIRQKKHGESPASNEERPSIRVSRVGLERTAPTLKVLCSTS